MVQIDFGLSYFSWVDLSKKQTFLITCPLFHSFVRNFPRNCPLEMYEFWPTIFA